METPLGLLFAFGAMLAWAFGDFFIQRTSRLVGNWKALFFIGITGAVGFLPLVWHELLTLSLVESGYYAAFAALVVFFALIDFEAMRRGKLAIVQPIISLELVWTVLLALAFVGERLTPWQYVLIILALGGTLLTFRQEKRRWWFGTRFERGVWLALVASVGMGAINLGFGVLSNAHSPLVTVWATHTGALLACIVYLAVTGKWRTLGRDLKRYPLPIVAESIFDNLSWLSFGYATLFIPIAVATTISEAYIALSALLGVIVNRERLTRTQAIGVTLSIGAVLALAAVTGE